MIFDVNAVKEGWEIRSCMQIAQHSTASALQLVNAPLQRVSMDEVKAFAGPERRSQSTSQAPAGIDARHDKMYWDCSPGVELQ